MNDLAFLNVSDAGSAVLVLVGGIGGRDSADAVATPVFPRW